MHGVRPVVRCPDNKIGTPNQTIKIKRGGTGGSGNAGPVGWKTRPSVRLNRALADMAAQYRHRKK